MKVKNENKLGDLKNRFFAVKISWLRCYQASIDNFKAITAKYFEDFDIKEFNK